MKKTKMMLGLVAGTILMVACSDDEPTGYENLSGLQSVVFTPGESVELSATKTGMTEVQNGTMRWEYKIEN